MSLARISTPTVLAVLVPATLKTPGFSATAVLDSQRHQYYAASITMEHIHLKLTTAQLAKTPIQKTMAPVLRHLLADANPDLVAEHTLVRRWTTGRPQRPVSRKIIDKPDDATLEATALTYWLARLCGEPSVKAIARAGGIEHSEALQWLRLARSRKLV